MITTDEIHRMRQDLGISAENLAQWMGVAVRSVWRWEAGDRQMGAPAEKLFRAYYDVAMAEKRRKRA